MDDRLILTAKVKDCNMCWEGAFTRVTDCADTRMQMRRLDRVREGMLCKVWRMVSGGIGHAGAHACAPCGFDFVECSLRSKASSVHFVTLPCGGEGEQQPVRRYKGRPFSYYGFLEKAVRPTNLRLRRQQFALPYSEL